MNKFLTVYNIYVRIGEVISSEESILRNSLGNGGYFVYLTKDLVLDCYGNKDNACMASMANTAANAYDPNDPTASLKNNASIVAIKESGSWVAYLKVRESHIEAGEEILAPYSIPFNKFK